MIVPYEIVRRVHNDVMKEIEQRMQPSIIANIIVEEFYYTAFFEEQARLSTLDEEETQNLIKSAGSRSVVKCWIEGDTK